MKNNILLAFLSISTVFAQERTKINEKELQGELFLLNDITLITNLKIDPKRFKDQNRIISIPTVELNSASLKEGDVIQFISFSDGKVREFKLGKNVFVLLIDKDGNELKDSWNSFNVILSNEPEQHKKVLQLSKSNPIQGNGIAYNGKDLTFRDGSYDKLFFSKLHTNDPKRKIFLSQKNDIRVTKTDIFSLYLDFTQEGPWHTNLISTPKDNYLLDPVNMLFENKIFSIQVGNFSKDYQFLLSLIIPDLICSRMYFITKEKVLFKDVFCGADKKNKT